MSSALHVVDPELKFSEMSILLVLTAWLATLTLFVIAFCFGKTMTSMRFNVDVKVFNVVQNVKYARFYVNGIPDVIFLREP